MAKNNNLHSAKNAKNDEFYTQLEDIEREMVNYVPFFEDKVVYCNCDDYRLSNFTKCFKDNFEYLKLKKVICTNYDNGNGAWKYEYDGENETVIQLEGNGGYKTEECIAFLKEADVVVTNPPFSLFRDYVKQLMDYNKKFLIIGNMNAITYKEIFPYIKNSQLWLGYGFKGGNAYFKYNGDCSAFAKGVYNQETGLVKFRNCSWFTNITTEKRNTTLDLYRKYNPTDYPKYDNYDAIEVSKVTDIPEDYDGVMGVPITFLDKYCPTQFEIVDINPHFYSIVEQGLPKPKKLTLHSVGKKDPYARILIRKLS